MANANELYHYGVLGMKWGVHRARSHAKAASKYRTKADKSATLSVLAKQQGYDTAEEWGAVSRKQTAKADKHHAKSNYEYKSWGTKHNEKLAKKWADKFHEASTNKSTHTTDTKHGKQEVFNSAKDARRQMRAYNKAQKYNRRFERSKELDRREQSYATRVSAGGNIAVRMLTGGAIGSKPYQQYVSMMGAQGKGNALMKTGAAIATSVLGGRLGSTAVKAIYLRSGERDALNSPDQPKIYGDNRKKK